MANAGGIPDLGPLPGSDDNAELQRSSTKALNALLRDQDTILLRDERIEDYGVDAAFQQQLMSELVGWQADVPQGGVIWVFAVSK